MPNISSPEDKIKIHLVNMLNNENLRTSENISECLALLSIIEVRNLNPLSESCLQNPKIQIQNIGHFFPELNLRQVNFILNNQKLVKIMFYENNQLMNLQNRKINETMVIQNISMFSSGQKEMIKSILECFEKNGIVSPDFCSKINF